MNKTGTIIKELRKEKKLTQQQLADIVGVQKSAVAKWETGRTKNLKRATVDALAILFGVRPSYILGEEDETLLLDGNEIKLVKAFRKADQKTQNAIRALLEIE